jgi:hypothetical protein
MGIMMRDAAAILANPDDLHIEIYEDNKNPGKFGFIISRGPGDRYQPLISTNAPSESRKEAVNEAIKLLKHFVANREQIVGKGTMPGAIFNPDEIPLDQMNLLNEAKVGWIECELRAGRDAETKKIKPME